MLAFSGPPTIAVATDGQTIAQLIERAASQQGKSQFGMRIGGRALLQGSKTRRNHEGRAGAAIVSDQSEVVVQGFLGVDVVHPQTRSSQSMTTAVASASTCERLTYAR